MPDEMVYSGLLHALVLDGQGRARRVGFAEMQSLNLEEHESLWLHWDRSHAQAREWLRTQSGLSGFACDVLLEENTRPRVLPLSGDELLRFFVA